MVSGECEGTTVSPGITCRFTQLTIRYPLDPKDVAAETDKRLAQLCAKAGKDLRKFTDQLCGEIQKSGAEVEHNLIRANTGWAQCFQSCARADLAFTSGTA